MIKGVILALLSALLLTLSFPKFDLEFLAWIALVPLFIAVKDKKLKSTFALSFLAGFSFLSGIFYWIKIVSDFKWGDYILLGTYLSLYFGLFGLVLNFISEKKNLPSIVVTPALWVSIEYIRSNAGFLGLPWPLLGHSQYLNLPVIQISSFTGVYGVSFLIVMTNAALSEVILHWRPKEKRDIVRYYIKLLIPAIVTLFVLGLSFIYGYIVISQQTMGGKVNITVIQGNIPQDIKWSPDFQEQNLNKHMSLTKEASSNNNTSLIVWPEASVQGPFTHNILLLQTISDLTKETETHLLIGSSQRPKFGSREFRKRHWFNSAFLTSPKGTIEGQYNKIYLLPFAEYLPYQDILSWPSSFITLAGNTIPGKEYTIFNLNGAKFGVLICWENIFPELFRKFVRNGAQFTVNITNEAWFGETAAPYQFVSMSVFRAVENHVSVVRSANTGISCFISPYGEIIGKVKNKNKDIFVEGYLTMAIPLSYKKTFYTMHGDIFAYVNIVMTMFLIALSFLKIRKG